MYFNETHKEIIEIDSNYEYLGSYCKGSRYKSKTLKHSYIEVRHKFCETVYLILPNSFKSGNRCTHCCKEYKNSIKYALIEVAGFDISTIWDYKKNNLRPECVPKKSSKKIWIKCKSKKYHGSYQILTSNIFRAIASGNNGCPYCSSRKIHPKDSFAQYHIDNTDSEFLEKYWDYEKNIVDPFEISKSSKKKVWIKCIKKDYHGSYEIVVSNLFNCIKNNNLGCSHCSSKKVHPLDSFGYHHFDKVMSWHPDNKISPFRVALNSPYKYMFICDICGDIFYKSLRNINHRGDWCSFCSMSKGELRIKSFLNDKNVNFIYEKSFDGLIGLGGGLLSYDFYLPEHNILIEYQGEYHDGSVLSQTSEGLEKQLEHDRRKMEYATKNNIKLISIWYYDFDNIEYILNLMIE